MTVAQLSSLMVNLPRDTQVVLYTGTYDTPNITIGWLERNPVTGRFEDVVKAGPDTKKVLVIS